MGSDSALPPLPEHYVRTMAMIGPEVLSLTKVLWQEAWYRGAMAGLMHSTAPIIVKVTDETSIDALTGKASPPRTGDICSSCGYLWDTSNHAFGCVKGRAERSDGGG